MICFCRGKCPFIFVHNLQLTKPSEHSCLVLWLYRLFGLLIGVGIGVVALLTVVIIALVICFRRRGENDGGQGKADSSQAGMTLSSIRENAQRSVQITKENKEHTGCFTSPI